MKSYDLTQRHPQTEQGVLPYANGADDRNLPPGKGYSIIEETISSILATIVLAIVVSGFYPLLIWGIGQGLFNHQANGSLIVGTDGKTILGSSLLGQNFGGKQYFNPRPSAAGAAGYDPTASGGTNLGPTSDKLVNGQHKKDAAGKPVNDPANYDGIKDLVPAYRSANGLKDTDPVPADAVTRSASGLDPDISLANAQLQLPRVARERKLDEAAVRQLVDRYTTGPDWRVFGEPRVNTLLLNLALDGKLPAGDNK
jgi:K+-transporting ATPase ATPase C chain